MTEIAEESADKRMKLRYAGTCHVCGAELPARTEAIYERATKAVRCIECPPGDSLASSESNDIVPVEPLAQPELEPGMAGSSARREYERRRANDEAKLREKWGRLGGVAVALSDEKQSTKAWAVGAVGEERLGQRLNSLASGHIAVLHDRRIPGTKANIDHIVITRAAVWVIDAKRYKGRPQLSVEGGILRPRVEKLLVGRRDCSSLVEGVLKQAELVSNVVADVPVTAALCFVDADWPLIGGSFVTRGVQVLWPKRLAALLSEASTGPVDVVATRTLMANHFKQA
jgi:Nuclease-related domain